MKLFDDIIENKWWFYICLTIICFLLAYGATSQTKDSVLNYMKQVGVQCPEVVIRQSILETGHFTSDICKENHNLFGMKYAKQRPTVAIGESKGHAMYRSWRWSVVDLYLWQQEFYHGGDYYDFLKRIGYATSKEYIKKLNQIKI